SRRLFKVASDMAPSVRPDPRSSRVDRAPVYEAWTFVSLSYTDAGLTAPNAVVGVAPEICTQQRMLRAHLSCVIAALALAGCGNDLGFGATGAGADPGPDANTATASSGAGLPC